MSNSTAYHPHGIAHFFSDHPKLGPLMAFIALAAGLSQRHTATGVWLCISAACLVVLLWAHDIALDKGKNAVWGTLKGVPWCIVIISLGWWLNQPESLSVIFKNPADVTFYRQYRIRRAITLYRAYLSEVGFEVPKEKPLVVIGGGGNGILTHAQAPIGEQHPLMPNGIMLTKEQSTDDKEVSFDSSVSFFATAFLSGIPRDPVEPRLAQLALGQLYAEYFSYSYWNRAGIRTSPWLKALWDMRSKFGKAFMDNVLTFVFRYLTSYHVDGETNKQFDKRFSDALWNTTTDMLPDMRDSEYLNSVKKKYDLPD
jgi:hypothetical protein